MRQPVIFGLLALAACGSSNGTGVGGGTTTTSTTTSTSTTSPTSTGSGTGVTCAVAKAGIAVSDGNATAPAIAWTGKSYAIVYADTSTDAGDVRLALVDANGTRTANVVISSDGNPAAFPSVIVTNNGYLVLWQETTGTGTKIFARRVNTDGTTNGTAFIVATSTNAEARPEGVLIGANVATAWADAVTSSIAIINGTTLGAPAQLTAGISPALAVNGSTLGATWASGTQLAFAAVKAPYTAINATFRSVDANIPRIAATGAEGFFIVWEDLRNGVGNESVFLAQGTLDGKLQGELEIPSAAGSANYPDVAWSGDHAAVVYYQFQGGPAAVYLQQVSAKMTKVGSTLLVSGKAAAKYPRITWSGTDFGVAYAEVDGGVKLSLVSCK